MSVGQMRKWVSEKNKTLVLGKRGELALSRFTVILSLSATFFLFLHKNK